MGNSDNSRSGTPPRAPDPRSLVAAGRASRDVEAWESILSTWDVVTMILMAALAVAAAYSTWFALRSDPNRWHGLATMVSPPTWPVHAASALAATCLFRTIRKWRRRSVALAPPFVPPLWFKESLELVESQRGGSEGQLALQEAVNDVGGHLAFWASGIRVGTGVLAVLTPSLAVAWTLAIMETDLREGRSLIDLAAPLIVAIVEGVVVVALAVLDDRRAQLLLNDWKRRVYSELNGSKRVSRTTGQREAQGFGHGQDRTAGASPYGNERDDTDATATGGPGRSSSAFDNSPASPSRPRANRDPDTSSPAPIPLFRPPPRLEPDHPPSQEGTLESDAVQWD